MSLSLISLVPAFSEGLSLMENKLMSWWSSNDWNSFRHGGSVRNFVCMIFSDVRILPHISTILVSLGSTHLSCEASLKHGVHLSWANAGKSWWTLFQHCDWLWVLSHPVFPCASLFELFGRFCTCCCWKIFLGSAFISRGHWITVIWALSLCLLCLTEHLHWK